MYLHIIAPDYSSWAILLPMSQTLDIRLMWVITTHAFRVNAKQGIPRDAQLLIKLFCFSNVAVCIGNMDQEKN